MYKGGRNMKKTKVISFLLVGIISLTGIFQFGTETVKASETSNVEISLTEEEKQIIRDELINNQDVTVQIDENQSKGVETRSVGSALVKRAIRKALKNNDELIKVIRKYVGSDAARMVEKQMGKINPVLKRLLQYDSLVWNTVQDKVTSGLIRAGLSSTNASRIGYWVRKGLEWLV